MNCIPMRRLPPALHRRNSETRNVLDNDLGGTGNDSDRGSNKGVLGETGRRVGAADDHDDIFMMTEDDDEEMIAVVTTTTTSSTMAAEQEEDDDDDDQDQVNIIDNLVVMGCFDSSNERNDCEEGYLMGEDNNHNYNTQENSMGQLPESVVNSLRISASHKRTSSCSSEDDLDDPILEDRQQNKNDNGGKVTGNKNTINTNSNIDDNDNSDISGCR